MHKPVEFRSVSDDTRISLEDYFLIHVGYWTLEKTAQ